MKRRWIITLGVVGLVALGNFYFSRSDNSQQIKAVKETRLALRQQGFKTDLAEFNFFTSNELRAREAALTTGSHRSYGRSLPIELDIMSPIDSDAAEVIWKQVEFTGNSGEDIWAKLRQDLEQIRAATDAACNAALSGPIAFNLDASGGNGLLLPHLAGLKNLSQDLGRRAVLALHDGNKNSAWTNLLASTRLVTAWQPEATEISHLVRFACATITYNTTWQLLQEKSWSDEQLAGLQKEWESVDFFKGLPETVAFTRASAVETCQMERQALLISGLPLGNILRSPIAVWSDLQYQTRLRRYQKVGSYEDEKSLLLHYRDREMELANAIKSPTWFEMRQLPGVTSTVPFQSKHPSQMQTIMNLRQISMGFQQQAVGLSGKAANAEIRRRILLTAIALERHRVRTGSYPTTLQGLSPDLLTNPPTDFADGKPLRYRQTPDGNFVLYSVGLDCVDNQGTMQTRQLPSESPMNLRTLPGADLVWPRPASGSENQSAQERGAKVREDQFERAKSREATDEKRYEELHRATVADLLAMKQSRETQEPTYKGQLLSEILCNKNADSKTGVTLNDLLTLKQIITGEEPDIATFELPIGFDALTKKGTLQLLVDVGPPPTNGVIYSGTPEGRNYNGGGLLQKWDRATNGNSLLIWNTTYDSPGQHALQASLTYSPIEGRSTIDIKGPVKPFYSSNLCQFFEHTAQFNSSGVPLHAKLPEQDGTYSIELRSGSGQLLKIISGNTSNGIIYNNWNPIDEHGEKYTNSFINAVYNIKLSSSGKSRSHTERKNRSPH